MAKKVGWKEYAQEQMKKYPVDTKGKTHEEVLQAMIDYGTDLSGVDTTGFGKPEPAPAKLTTPSVLQSPGKAFWTKGAVNAKLQEIAKPKEVQRASRDADFAAWKRLPEDQQNGSFENWVQKSYSKRTGKEAARLNATRQPGQPKFKKREAPGLLTKAVRGLNDLVATDRFDGSLGQPVDGKLSGLGAAVDPLYRFFGGQSHEDAQLAEYMRLRSPAPDMGVVESGKAMGAAIYDDFGGSVREMFLNPRELGTNLASAIPLAGPLAKFTKLATVARAGEGFVNAATKVNPFLGTAARTVGRGTQNALMHPLADIGTGAVTGGLTSAALGEGDPVADFALGAGPGAVMGLAGKGMAKGAGLAVKAPGAVKEWWNGKKIEPPASELEGPLDKAVTQSRASRRGIGEEVLPEMTPDDVGAAVDLMHSAPTRFSPQQKVDFFMKYADQIDPAFARIDPAYQVAAANSLISKIAEQRKAASTATAEAAAGKVSGGRRGKQYTQADVDNLLANYIPENATPEQVAKIMASANIKTLRDTHTKLAHAAEQGLTTADGMPIPLRDDIRSLNILEERVKAADEAGAARVKEMTDKATDEAGKKAAKDAAAAETEAAAARKADLEYERGVNRLSVALRIAAGDEAILPGALKADILKMTPENMGIIMDDMIAGSGRFDEYADLISDAINKNNFEDLLDLRKAAAGDPELWKTGSKRIQDRAAKDLSKTEATQAGQMADAQSSEQIRQGMDQADATAEAATLAADEARIKEEARIADEEKAITAQSPEELQKTLYDAIMADPSKADLFGIEGHVARVAANEKSPSSKAMKTRLQSLLVDAAEKVKINGVPKGFF